MDLLNGVDFDKGCYVGQEVVSRMKHRGDVAQARRARAARRPGAGAGRRRCWTANWPVGALGSPAGRQALAMLRLDRVEEARAAGRALSAGGVGVVMAEGEGVGRP